MWVPANFINFDYRYIKDDGPSEVVTIYPDRQFATFEDAASILPLANKDIALYDTIAYLYGKSKAHQGTVKMTWKQNKKLEIDGPS